MPVWSEELSFEYFMVPPFFSLIMDKDHFKEIIRFLRFDHITERLERLKSDKFAMASALWYPFIENSASYYKTGVNLTVDEQLPPSKARFPFIQYIPCKPDKFRIKF
ncbi:hypothetical protein AVEN_46069-1 [Araneus ventricosus]|uniref:PiggyBac transposable element-derived protein domain-containing protein n=1 Tax=Araneus ventricosus TaxID=182803 RepID=A0A4Y2PG05_ARAVE|nr:hypothetical protein AVEN_2009-1 [Araneus ventricosus]GBN50953.1 hypothetical protein AVEN_228258-1 [Araneus ventricosus]GBN50982.1 hypothetical protein AVEN_266218-1 [Araneus ventricosus]GBN51017.1 hypothetical protein AVEN_46069-1 [Araneus ventricosus]